MRNILLIFVICNVIGSTFTIPNPQKTWDFLSTYQGVRATRSSRFCGLCQGHLDNLEKFFPQTQPTVTDVVDLIQGDICWMVGNVPFIPIVTADMCRNLVEQFGPQLFYIMYKRNYDKLLFCSKVFRVCDRVKDPPVPWFIAIPAPSAATEKQTVVVPTNANRAFVHLSDIHFDDEYLEGSNNTCDQTICCHSGRGKKSQETYAGKFGDRKCDIPLVTLTDMFEHIKTNYTFDSILFTGDTVSHDVWNQTKHRNIEKITFISDKITETFPKAKVFPCIGNHEPSPKDFFSPSNFTGPGNITWLYSELMDLWGTKKGWIPEGQRPDFLRGGFYITDYDKRLRVKLIALNTNLCYSHNVWLMLYSLDIDNQLQWLIQQLSGLEEGQYHVYIIGHMAPAHKECNKYFSSAFAAIVERFWKTIIGQFWGHTHTDSFYVQPSSQDKTKGVGVSFTVGSATTYYGLNPGFRLFDYDDTNGGLMNHRSFVANLTQANYKGVLVWEKEYDAKTAYGLPDLTAQSWLDFVYGPFDRNDSLVNDYVRYFHKLVWKGPLTDKDLAATRCAVKTYRSGDPSICSGVMKSYEDIQNRDFLYLQRC